MQVYDRTEYRDAIINELKLNRNTANGYFSELLLDYDYIESVTYSILEHAKSSLVPRCCGINGHLTSNRYAYESVGAHTNLVMTLVFHALDYIHQTTNLRFPHSSTDIVYAILMHDLPENITGDTPNNGERDEVKKHRIEARYFEHYKSSQYATRLAQFEKSYTILQDMDSRSTMLGRTIYLADRLSAIIATLTYDDKQIYPVAFPDDVGLSRQCVNDMSVCEHPIQVEDRIGYLLSELWTIDYLRDRKMYQFDDTGFFTAVLIMSTIFVRNKWYRWREADYK